MSTYVARCGEHSDYGTITLLYQDQLGGLEVKGVGGCWIQADPLPGCLLVNVMRGHTVHDNTNSMMTTGG